MEQAYAFFDFDGTVIRGDSIVAFSVWAYRCGDLSLPELLRCAVGVWRYHRGKAKAEEVKALPVSFLAGKSCEQVEAVGAAFTNEVLLKKLRPDAAREMAKCRCQGQRVVLVSASQTFYLQALRDALPLDEIIGTELRYDENGRYTGTVGPNCRGSAKPERIHGYLAERGETLDAKHSSAYGDSAGDWPMMQLCGQKVAVNAKRKLRELLQSDEHAVAVHWPDP